VKDLFTLSCDSLPDKTRVIGFTAVEGMSRLYEVKVYLLVPSADLELADAIGAKARLVIDRDDSDIPPFVFAGFFATMAILHELDGKTLVQGIIVPQLWQLGLSVHSRIFTKMSIPEIIEDILKDNGLSGDDYALRLGSYSKEEHVCQYHESDL